jgi:hypothetical protein
MEAMTSTPTAEGGAFESDSTRSVEHGRGEDGTL